MENRCMDCMRELDAGVTVCPHCGFDRSRYVPPKMALPPGSSLANSGYFIGRVLEQTEHDMKYAGHALASGENVVIWEYFPRRISERQDNHSFLQWRVPKGTEKFLQREFIAEVFQESTDPFWKRNPNIRDAFYQNRTSYIVTSRESKELESLVAHFANRRDSYMLSGSLLHSRYLIGRVLYTDDFSVNYSALDILTNSRISVRECFPRYIAHRNANPSRFNRVSWKSSSIDYRPKMQQVGWPKFVEKVKKLPQSSIIPTASVAWPRDFFFDADNDNVYIISDDIEGETLCSVLYKHGAMSVSDSIRLLLPIMQDIQLLHKSGITHGLINLENIIFRPDGRVGLRELGAEKDPPESLMIATPIDEYFPFFPSSSDFYCLCMTLYACLTGTTLFPNQGGYNGNQGRYSVGGIKDISLSDMKEPLPSFLETLLRSELSPRKFWEPEQVQSIDELLSACMLFVSNH